MGFFSLGYHSNKKALAIGDHFYTSKTIKSLTEGRRSVPTLSMRHFKSSLLSDPSVSSEADDAKDIALDFRFREPIKLLSLCCWYGGVCSSSGAIILLEGHVYLICGTHGEEFRVLLFIGTDWPSNKNVVWVSDVPFGFCHPPKLSPVLESIAPVHVSLCRSFFETNR